MTTQLPSHDTSFNSPQAQGFATPKNDNRPQEARFPPKRCLPIVFLPGVMGSNLRIKDKERIERLSKEENIAWRPDVLGAGNIGEVLNQASLTPAQRQLILDPRTTEVDRYFKITDKPSLTGESGDARHSNVTLDKNFSSPLLRDDPPGTPRSRTAEQKARARGWGEVFFDSYGKALQAFESMLNNMIIGDTKNGFDWKNLGPGWVNIVDTYPSRWECMNGLEKKITLDEFKKIATGCYFPVYAMGYNWLESNGESGRKVAVRIEQLIADRCAAGFECTHVILVTHSMGGLVARAVVHPAFGNLQDMVLGVVHGVQPVVGAAAAYKRMRTGFEDSFFDPVPKVLGNYGTECTAVLASTASGFELLPTKRYGNSWLQVKKNDLVLDDWPKNGDPYEEIYKARGKWYSLIREEWINPAHLPGVNIDSVMQNIDTAKYFHEKIDNTYSENTYAHWGADPKHKSFGKVVWALEPNKLLDNWRNLPIVEDNAKGTLILGKDGQTSGIKVKMCDPDSTGDETVPIESSDHHALSGKMKASFRQTGYDHQGSYLNSSVIDTTLYCILRIATEAKWKKEI